MATIGIAIIGSGIFATTEHLPAVQACSTLTLKAIYSRSLQSATALNEKAGGVDLYADDAGSGKTYHDLLLRTDIHAVIIALPILSQPEYIEAALLAGKHVLSEKPIASDLEAANKLIKFYDANVDKSKVFWGVAENFRFMDPFTYAAQEAAKMGRVLGFRVKMFTNVKAGAKYYETAWRKKPLYQGSDKPVAISAYTTLLQQHLPPVDTVNAIWETESGVSGTFSVSFGTTFKGREYSFAFEKGTVTVVDSTVTIEVDGKQTVQDFPSEGSGVKKEVAVFAQSIVEGKQNPDQSPEQALADLEVLEKMLRSGEDHGKRESLQYQIQNISFLVGQL